MKKTLIAFLSILMLLSGCGEKRVEIPSVSHSGDIIDFRNGVEPKILTEGGIPLQ